MAVSLIVLDSFECKLDHFGSNKELLEDGSLLAIFREDEELSKELEGSKVL